MNKAGETDMTHRIFILKVEDEDMSQLFVGAVVSDNPMVAMSALLDEVKSETNGEANLNQLELLEFPMKAA